MVDYSRERLEADRKTFKIALDVLIAQGENDEVVRRLDEVGGEWYGVILEALDEDQ